MTNLFYLLGVIFFLHELSILAYPKPYLDKISHMSKQNESGVRTPLDYANDEDRETIKLGLFSLIYFAWLVIGCVFAGQWMIFVGLTAFGIFISFLRKRWYKNNTMGSLRTIKFDALVSSSVLAFLILNHFHHII
jgi:hypothetical protein